MLYGVPNSHDSTITFMLVGAFLIVQLMPISPPLSFFFFFLENTINLIVRKS